MGKDKKGAVRAMIADAQEDVFAPVAGDLDPDPGANRGDVEPGKWEPGRLGLPDDCPVKPLGVDGDVFWFLDTIGQLRCTVPNGFGRAFTASLFMGRENYLYWAWPKRDKNAQVVSWRNERIQEAMMGACARLGPWAAVERVLGRGSWADRAGELIYHSGTRLHTPESHQPPGEHGGFVYPTRPAIAPPWPQPLNLQENPAVELLELLRTWKWVRPGADPVLLLGWIGAAFLGAALPWRPTVFMIGDKATGKSTLQELIKAIFGDALIQALDTTPAGVYQHVRHDCLPVAIDELEAEEDTRKQTAIIRLARLAASGGFMLRGGDRHNPVEFQARSCFLFSSINAPPMTPADLSRMVFLQLRELDAGAAEPTIDADEMLTTGRKILRQLMDNWHRLPATLEAYYQELAEGGHTGRGQKTYGTLLACADLILGEAAELASVPIGEDLRAWRELLAVETLPELEDATDNWRGCLMHILSVPVEAWRSGAKPTVGATVTDYYNGQMDFEGARGRLGQAGLSLQVNPGKLKGDWLAVPNQNPLTRKLFEGSKWHGLEGAGVWATALRQGERKTLWELGTTTINGVRSKATLISLTGLFEVHQVMDAGPDKPRRKAADT